MRSNRNGLKDRARVKAMAQAAGDSRLVVVDHALVQHKLTLMRAAETPPPLFRQLLRETAILLAYEAMRVLPTKPKAVETPMGPTEGVKLTHPPAVVSILRAGNGLLDGLLDIVPSASVGFIGMYRDEESLQPVDYYLNLPSGLEERVTIVVDPMLATAGSAISAVEKLREAGATDLRFMCLVAAPEGIERLQKAHPEVMIVTAAVDEGLNEIGYIVPGLGDAGDRIFGTE